MNESKIFEPLRRNDCLEIVKYRHFHSFEESIITFRVVFYKITDYF